MPGKLVCFWATDLQSRHFCTTVQKVLDAYFLMPPQNSHNPLLALPFEPALEDLGDDYYDEVAAADFPEHQLRFRNDDALRLLGLDPVAVSDEHFVEAFGRFEGRRPFLALRYHGYQFGTYNPALGDGRGFLYGQVRTGDGHLVDFGTKGSGTTPYSRHADGRLTLKGGVREVLAAEALHHLGVRTSRAFSLIETGEQLWRGDEPSPTRSSVLVRLSRTHIRFGTFERLHYFGRKDLIRKLLDHVIAVYYPQIWKEETDPASRDARFYATLVERTAELCAQWMAVGFCHAVLNTDNLSIAAESFDYGPYAFIERYDPRFTAAYFDYFGQYSYGNQPRACYWNLGMLQQPLALVMAIEDLGTGLRRFSEHYDRAYAELMLAKLGLPPTLDEPLATDLLRTTLDLLETGPIGYHDFFVALADAFRPDWRDESDQICSGTLPTDETLTTRWRQLYGQALQTLPPEALDTVSARLARNPRTVLLRPRIEAVWEPIVEDDDWRPFGALLAAMRTEAALGVTQEART